MIPEKIISSAISVQNPFLVVLDAVQFYYQLCSDRKKIQDMWTESCLTSETYA